MRVFAFNNEERREFSSIKEAAKTLGLDFHEVSLSIETGDCLGGWFFDFSLGKAEKKREKNPKGEKGREKGREKSDKFFIR